MRKVIVNAIYYSLIAVIVLFALSLLATQADANNSRRDCPNPYAVASHFGTYEGGEGFNPRFDLNGDGAVTVGDIIIASNCWLEARP